MCFLALALVLAAPRDVSPLLEPILKQHGIPGMVAVVVAGNELVLSGAVGVRQKGAESRVTLEDRFHLGSCTKSMTATLCAMLVEKGKLKWTSTVGELFADVAMDDAWRTVTLAQLCTNHAGAPADLETDGLWERLWKFAGTPVEARQALLEGVVRHPPVSRPGSAFLYSNAGFSIAGHMAEKAAGKSWEDLMREMLFVPLGMATAGFSAPGVAATLDQPRGHHADGTPVQPGPGSDNPVAIGPAGIVHCSVPDWARYISLHLLKDRLLQPESFTFLHTAADPEQSYACGWLVTQRGWAQGGVLTHAGSNTMWFCVTWLAPRRNFAVLVACNIGGDKAAQGADTACATLIQEFLQPR